MAEPATHKPGIQYRATFCGRPAVAVLAPNALLLPQRRDELWWHVIEEHESKLLHPAVVNSEQSLLVIGDPLRPGERP